MTLKTRGNSRLLFMITMAVTFWVTEGCATWKVVRASGPPSALKGANEVVVQFDYSKMLVNSTGSDSLNEEEWVARKLQKEPEYRTTWADLKGRFEKGVLEGVQDRFSGGAIVRPASAGDVPPGAVVLQVQVRRFQLGQYIPFVLPPTILKVELIYLAGGQVTDEIAVERAAGHDIIQPSVFSVISGLSRSVGDAGGAYLKRAQ